MGFIMEFAENLILRMMEDPKERERKWREHVYRVKDRCEKTKEMWSYPIRPYGFWTFDRHNAQIFWDSQISQVPGRRDPYDDLLEGTFDVPSPTTSNIPLSGIIERKLECLTSVLECVENYEGQQRRRGKCERRHGDGEGSLYLTRNRRRKGNHKRHKQYRNSRKKRTTVRML